MIHSYRIDPVTPCSFETRRVRPIRNHYRDRGVAFLGINVFDERQDAQGYAQEFGLSYPNATDPSGAVAIEYGLAGVPEKFLIGRDGRLLRRFVGPMSEDTLRRLLDEQLAAGG